jgi:hypothetical protein
MAVVKRRRLCHKTQSRPVRKQDIATAAGDKNQRGVLKVNRNKRLSEKVIVVALTLLMSQWSFAAPGSSVKEDPSAAAMTADLLFVRPVMFSVTVLGSAVWLVGLPFSAAGGNIKESAETLVVGPAMSTFVRCLGCTKIGYQDTIEE